MQEVYEAHTEKYGVGRYFRRQVTLVGFGL